MKKSIFTLIELLVLCLFAVLPLGLAAGENGPVFSTTMDFADLVFEDKEAKGDLYPLDLYEKRLREIAECGTKKIYLRLSDGVTLYPTKTSVMFGDGGAIYLQKNIQPLVKRLSNTIRSYDVCAETIRIAHKYGMEAWARIDLADDGSGCFFPDDPELSALAAKVEHLPFMDPYFRAHPECYAMRDPRFFTALPEKNAELNAEAREFPVGKIVVTNRIKRPPLRVTGDEIEIYTSNDNRSWTRYDKPFKFTSGVTKEGFNTFTIDGLEITARYVKLSHKDPYPATGFTVVLSECENQNLVYNTKGKKIASFWSANINYTPTGGGWHETGGLWMLLPGGVALDHKKAEIGFAVGIPDKPWGRYFQIPEYTVPATFARRVERFKELAAYPFDGFMIGNRTHSRVDDPNQYGFNPEVREKFKARFGKDIWRDKFDLGDLLSLRAEAIGDYYLACKKAAGGRPIWINGFKPVKPGEFAPNKPFGGMGAQMLANIPMQYKRWISSGAIDGVMMIGEDFSGVFTPDVTGGKPIKLGLFREGSNHLPHYRAKGYDFETDVKTLAKMKNIDEVEYYETLEFYKRPQKRDVFREVTGGGAKPAEKN